MTYIICYKLNRKNAIRREYLRFKTQNGIEDAKIKFHAMVDNAMILKRFNDTEFELLTGDWKSICKYKANDKINKEEENNG